MRGEGPGLFVPGRGLGEPGGPGGPWGRRCRSVWEATGGPNDPSGWCLRWCKEWGGGVRMIVSVLWVGGDHRAWW